MDYTTLSLSEVTALLRGAAEEAETAFGALDAPRLAWRVDPAHWSVGQCLEHLVTANTLMLRAADHALKNPPNTVWQRLPLWPRLFGQLLIRSQSPDRTRKFKAPLPARPASSVPDDVVRRFVAQHCAAAEWMRAIDERAAARAVMISPFIRIVTYSVLDGFRLLIAHDRRHLAQAHRVMRSTGFP